MNKQEKEAFFKSEFYDIDIECTNCGASPSSSINIPMGVYWEVYLREAEYKCGYCGCIGHMVRV